MGERKDRDSKDWQFHQPPSDVFQEKKWVGEES